MTHPYLTSIDIDTSELGRMAMKKLYELIGADYDGFLVRRPKLSLILDDCSGYSFISGQTINNKLY